ncbi:uncharacterized protein LOC142474739 isoform X2 [Ascaphus truei]|uniref:uncharacterized protein LOC142474739 isoform X2 n=1 Tax=Ascaphus truei TaxID=8439 RepID=UPI003F597DCD
MRSKELSMQVKQGILKLQKKRKSIREIAGTLGVSKSTVWYILRKQERTGELCSTKRPGRPRKTTVLDDRTILSMVKKNPFTTSSQVKNTLQEVGISLSKSTIKRRLHESKYSVFNTRCKPFLSLKNRKARLDFAKYYQEKPSQFWNSILWADETKINLYQKDGKKKVPAKGVVITGADLGAQTPKRGSGRRKGSKNRIPSLKFTGSESGMGVHGDDGAASSDVDKDDFNKEDDLPLTVSDAGWEQKNVNLLREESVAPERTEK